MRILYDHQAFSLQDIGGITVYFYELAKRLSAVQGVSVDVARGANRSHYALACRSLPRLHVFEWESKTAPGFRRYALNEAVTSAWSLLQSQWDIYHSTLYRKMPAVRSRACVATNHDCTQDRFPELFQNPNRVTEAKRRLYAQVDVVVCVSEFSRRDLLSFYDIPVDKTRVIYQGFPRLSRNSDKAAGFLGRMRRPYLLYVGARYSYKNFDGFLKAFANGGFGKDYDLVTIGGGAFTDAEQSLIAKLGLESVIQLWPSASDAVIAEGYASAALFVSPSLYEGFGLPPLEALSMECPVLASCTASVPEICGDAAYYFDPRVEGDLERSLASALNATDRRERLAGGRERVEQFNWQKSAMQTLELYRSLIG